MRVFISWSGRRSHAIAEQLHAWMPRVIQRLDPYISSRDIEKGARWAQNLAGELNRANFGVVCLTPDNLLAPWIQFESGALSKSLEHGKVVPVLFGVDETELAESPLLQFQYTKFDRDDMLKLVRTMNDQLAEGRLKPDVLDTAFDKNWSDLLRATEEQAGNGKLEETRSNKRDIALDEITALAREQLRRITNLEDRLGIIVPSNLTSVAHIEALKLVDHMSDFCDALRDEVGRIEDQSLGESPQKQEEHKELKRLLGSISLALRDVSQKGGSTEVVSKAVLQFRRAIGLIGSLRFK